MDRALQELRDLSDVESLTVSFVRDLRVRNLAPNTVRTYRMACEGLARFLRERGMPTTVAAIHREHVESFIEYLLSERSAGTAANRYPGSLRVLPFPGRGRGDP